MNYITELQVSKSSFWVRRLISLDSSYGQWREKRSSNRNFEHVSHVPSANCPREEFLPFCYLVESWGSLSRQQIALWASWRQAGNKPSARAEVASDGSLDVSGVQCSPSFLRKLVRWGTQNFSMPKKCFGLWANTFSAEIPAQTFSWFLGRLQKLSCSVSMHAGEIVQEKLLVV